MEEVISCLLLRFCSFILRKFIPGKVVITLILELQTNYIKPIFLCEKLSPQLQSCY